MEQTVEVASVCSCAPSIFLSLSLLQLWLTLSEQHLVTRGVEWEKAERFCFNEWSNPDDDELGLQIVRVREGIRNHRKRKFVIVN